jgi:Bifunctional DNA primase/polymerase, N-terminal
MNEQMTTELNVPISPFHGAPSGHSRYYDIALPMLQKGLTVWPVRTEPEKAAEYGWNTHAYNANEIVHRCLANKFPNHNAAVISKRGIGNLMFLDVDSSGVLERIEKETGWKISGITFTVCSRPQTAPYKRHLYFRQTARSLSKWRTEVNVRDISKWTVDKNGDDIHPTLFDLKGVGGGGYVVAPGSVRANEETYTVIDDLPVSDIPDWLVDWLANEITSWNSERRKEQIQHTAKVAALPKAEQTAIQKAGDPSGFKYPASEMYAFMNWRAAILASNAVSKKNITRQISEELNRDFAGGKVFAASEEGKKKIRRIVASKKLGTLHYDWVGPRKKVILQDGLKFSARQTRQSLMAAAMRKFPQTVSASDGYARLRRALVGTGFDLFRGKAAEKAVAQVRKAVGYSAQRTEAGWVWVKPPNHITTNTHIQ